MTTSKAGQDGRLVSPVSRSPICVACMYVRNQRQDPENKLRESTRRGRDAQ